MITNPLFVIQKKITRLIINNLQALEGLEMQTAINIIFKIVAEHAKIKFSLDLLSTDSFSDYFSDYLLVITHDGNQSALSLFTQDDDNSKFSYRKFVTHYGYLWDAR